MNGKTLESPNEQKDNALSFIWQLTEWMLAHKTQIMVKRV
jgi:hypothetical protein